MKKLTILAALVSILAASPAQALDISSGSGGRAAAPGVGVSLTALFPTMPDAPRFTARGEGRLSYSSTGKLARIDAESIPDMRFESDGPLGGERSLVVTVEAVPGTSPVLDWSQFPRVAMRSLDLRVRAYGGGEAGRAEGGEPLVDVVLGDLSFSTDRVEVEGMEAQGYVDAASLEAQLVGKTTLPEDPFPLYSEWLAGEPVILELRVRMDNPYGR